VDLLERGRNGAAAQPPYLTRLGPEPLGKSFTPDYLIQVGRGRLRPIKNLLLDQGIVAGIGNIYANEALFAAGILPQRPAGSLSKEEAGGIIAGVRTVLRAALDAGGSTIRDFRTPDGSEGAFTRELAVYGRHGSPCLRCGESIHRVVLGGRSTFFCPGCQH